MHDSAVLESLMKTANPTHWGSWMLIHQPTAAHNAVYCMYVKIKGTVEAIVNQTLTFHPLRILRSNFMAI